MPARLPCLDSDLSVRRGLLALAVDVIGNQAKAAVIIGCAPSAVSQWLSGEREVEWHVVHAAMQRAIRRSPGDAARLIEAFAEAALDTEGRWVQPGPAAVGSFLEEAADVSVALGDMVGAVRSGDPREVRRSAVRLEREAREAGLAAERVVA